MQNKGCNWFLCAKRTTSDNLLPVRATVVNLLFMVQKTGFSATTFLFVRGASNAIQTTERFPFMVYFPWSPVPPFRRGESHLKVQCMYPVLASLKVS